MISDLLNKILSGNNLSIEEAYQGMNTIMKGEATPVQISSFLIAMKQKRETAEEIAGFVKGMREHSLKVTLDDPNAVDGCGTGGDGTQSFNISTAATIITSAAGVTVAKHGNRSISSKCGSADILEKSGGNIDPGVEIVQDNINKVGFGFMFAPKFHPAMKFAMPVRKELGIRTFFNILGPMTNPANVKRQVIGVYDKDLMFLMAEVMTLVGVDHLIVVHAHDGHDEFSISAPSDYIEIINGVKTEHTIDPTQINLKIFPAESIKGGDAEVNMNIMSNIFNGEKSGCRDAVLINAAALIKVSGKTDSFKEGVEFASEAIDNGSAREKLKQWVEASNNI